MRVAHPFETLLVRALAAGVRSLSWKRSLALGERLGDLARGLGLRRRVAEDNLARAFPERSIAERSAILREHYRELGRVVVEYARLDELARAPRGQVMAEIRGLAHIEAARGRGAILLTGHFGNFELGGATLRQLHPVDVVVRPLSNPGVEAILASARAAAGLTLIPADRGIRRVYESLHAGRWVAMVGDQDARRHGVFVPFMGRPASAALGPARIALATGASIIMGFMMRQTDGRMVLEVEPPLEIPDPGASDAALRLTALHTARLEARVRARPEMWFWVHRRWKTRPAGEPQPAAAPERSASPEESAARAPGDDTTARRTAAQAS